MQHPTQSPEPLPGVVRAESGLHWQRPVGGRARGFTLAELLVVVAILAILGSLTAAGITRTMARGRRVACIANLRQLSMNLVSFVGEYHQYPMFLPKPETRSRYPGQETTWLTIVGGEDAKSALSGSDSGSSLIRCPAFTPPQRDSVSREEQTRLTGFYGYNAFGLVRSDGARPMGLGAKKSPDAAYPHQELPVEAGDVVSPAEMLAMGDGVMGWHSALDDGTMRFERNLHAAPLKGSAARVRNRHEGALVAGFCDGHVETLSLHHLFSTESESYRALWSRNHRPQ